MKAKAMVGKLEMEVVKMAGIKSPHIKEAAEIWTKYVYEDGRLSIVNRLLRDVEPHNENYRKAKVLLEKRVENLKSQLRDLGWQGEIK